MYVVGKLRGEYLGWETVFYRPRLGVESDVAGKSDDDRFSLESVCVTKK